MQETTQQVSLDPTLLSLRKRVSEYTGLETFRVPPGLERVTLTSDEVTSLCPVTGQPDFYQVEVTYVPGQRCVESKTWKLFLQSTRQKGMFCEEFACFVLEECLRSLQPKSCRVIVTQKPRGGVGIVAEAYGESPK